MTYNGWSNYETWRVNVEMIDGVEEIAGWDAEQIEEYCIEIINELSDGLARRYAIAFLRNVNWREIEEHLKEIYGLCKTCNAPASSDYCDECKEGNDLMTSYDKG